jgi:hypothetical protein
MENDTKIQFSDKNDRNKGLKSTLETSFISNMVTIGNSHLNIGIMTRSLRHALKRPAKFNQNNLIRSIITDVTRIIVNFHLKSQFLNTGPPC